MDSKVQELSKAEKVAKIARFGYAEGERMTDSIPALNADALAYIDKTIDNVIDVPTSVWRSDEVVEMLRELRGMILLSAPPASDDEKADLRDLIYHYDYLDGASGTMRDCEGLRDAILAAGFRRLPSLSREALPADLVNNLQEMASDTSGDLRDWMCDAAKSAADILSRLSVPEPAEVEWAVKWTGTEGEPVTDLGADKSDVRELARQQEGYAVAVKRSVGPWVLVEKGEEQ